ncbi:hypothetical protein HMPREF9374_3518 [Desmospora sp. 8437]|nr:hypothetical protein HMPREF9374_3518 [Desmospora sp. 8437]
MWGKTAGVWLALVLLLTGCLPDPEALQRMKEEIELGLDEMDEDFDEEFPCGLGCQEDKDARFVTQEEVEEDYDFYFNIFTDRKTGCQYLTTDVGVTPLLTKEGKPDCDPKRIEKK